MDFRRRLTLLIGLSVGAVAILIAVLLFLGSDISKTVAQIKGLQEDFGFKLQSAGSFTLLKEDYKQAEPYLTAIKNILPTQEQLVNLSRDLVVMANQNGVSLNSGFGNEYPPVVPGLRGTRISIGADAPFGNLMGFMKTLENSRYFVNLTSLDFFRENINFRVSLVGEIFSL